MPVFLFVLTELLPVLDTCQDVHYEGHLNNSMCIICMLMSIATYTGRSSVKCNAFSQDE